MESEEPNSMLPAYPIFGSHTHYDASGLTKRELFAAMFMQGMITSGGDSGDTRLIEGWRICMAAEAVRYSEALLEALDGGAK